MTECDGSQALSIICCEGSQGRSKAFIIITCHPEVNLTVKFEKSRCAFIPPQEFGHTFFIVPTWNMTARRISDVYQTRSVEFERHWCILTLPPLIRHRLILDLSGSMNLPGTKSLASESDRSMTITVVNISDPLQTARASFTHRCSKAPPLNCEIVLLIGLSAGSAMMEPTIRTIVCQMPSMFLHIDLIFVSEVHPSRNSQRRVKLLSEADASNTPVVTFSRSNIVLSSDW